MILSKSELALQSTNDPPLSPNWRERLRSLLFGKPKSPLASDVFHKISLAAFFAWIGLGADGLSSSAYGPDEAFRALGEHTYLAVALVGARAFTIFLLSYTYSRIIEHIPSGGGGTSLPPNSSAQVSVSFLVRLYSRTMCSRFLSPLRRRLMHPLVFSRQVGTRRKFRWSVSLLACSW